MARPKVNRGLEQYLEAQLDQLMKGQILLQDLPLPIQAWFFAGESYGRAARQPEIDQLEREVNRLHNLAFETDHERRDRVEARLSQALEEATEETWDRIEADLAAMAGRQLNIDADAAPAAEGNAISCVKKISGAAGTPSPRSGSKPVPAASHPGPSSAV